MKANIASTCISAVAMSACSINNGPLPGKGGALIDSEEVALYKDNIGRVSLPDFLKQHEKRADEPYVIAGEDVERLELMTLSLIKSLGDEAFSAELGKLTPRQVAGVAVFVPSKDLGGS